MAPASPDASSAPGIDADAVGAWWRRHVPDVALPLSFARIEGGLSNLTYAVADQRDRRWVLRRPPLHGVLASAHDMAREHRIMAALADTAVPVPPVVAHEPDPSVTGAEFFVMDFVAGPVHRDPRQVASGTDAAERAAVSGALVDALVALHAVDPDEVGLGDLGRREDWCARQLRRWGQQWDRVATRSVPAFAEVQRRLAADIPDQQGVAIVHGDYRLDNVIGAPGGGIAAIVDWELCTLGDPLADLGILCAYWVEPDDAVRALPRVVTDLPGFATRAELVDRYGRRSGRDVDDIDFYLALGYWRLAAILEGVHARFRSGAYGDDLPHDVGQLPDRVDDLVAAALVAVERAGR